MSIPPVWIPSWQHEDVEFKETNLLHDKFYKLKQFRLRHKCFSGEWSAWLVREQVHHSDAAAVLLVDLKQQKLVLVEQFRVGLLGRSATSPWLLEIVAGLLEPNEAPHETVMREAEEEAGCKIQRLFTIGEFYNSPGGFAEKTTVFCGIIDATGIGGIHGVGTEHEDIRVHVLDIDAVFRALEDKSFLTSSSTVIALQWLALNIKNGHLEQKLPAAR